jgi:virginiamycin B lyase
MREITLSGWTPYAIAASPAGPVWLTVLEPPGLARLEPGGGVTLRELPAKPMLVAVGADGTVWHTGQDDRIGRDGESWFSLPAGASPYGIAAAQDGGAFFSAPGIDRIGHVSASGEVEMAEAPGYAAMVSVGDDGAAWVALNAAGKLARWNGGAVNIVDIPPGRTAAAAPDGGCWVTLWGSGQLARVRGDRSVRLFDLPGREPHGLALVGDEIWVAMESGSVVCVPAGD